MSRYRIIGHRAEHEVVVGWDNPLQTYFVQVFPPEPADPDEDERPLAWLGGFPDELPTLEALMKVLKPYAALTQETMQQLSRDKRDAPPLSEIQAKTLAWLRKSEGKPEQEW